MSSIPQNYCDENELIDNGIDEKPSIQRRFMPCPVYHKTIAMRTS